MKPHRRTWLFASLLALGACASLLGLDERRRKPFEHRAHVTQGVTCTDCHAGIAEAGDEGPLHLPSDERCLDCHSPPHDPNPCQDCHGLPRTRETLASARQHLVFSHQRHLPELSGNCARCHVGVAEDVSPLLPSMATCLRCHQHEGQFASRECGACHRDLVAEAVRPRSHLPHDEAFIQSHGAQAASAADLCRSCHTEASCASCHGVSVPVLPARFAFDAPLGPDFHRAGFRSRHGLEAKTDTGLCLTCHATTSCASCHENAGLAATGATRGSPHPARGWVSATRGENAHGAAARQDPVGCAGCHQGPGEALCVGCHKVGGVGGNIHPPGFQSSLRKREDRPCRACHGEL